MSSFKLRVEDVLAAVTVTGLIAFLGFKKGLQGLAFEETQYWTYSFIMAPVALLVFVASVRYAVAGGRGLFSRTVSRITSVFRDWLPFLFLLLVYEAFNTNSWRFMEFEDRDAELLALDRLIFGESPAVTMQAIVAPWLTDILTVAYTLHLVAPPILGLMLYLRDRRRFREYVIAIMVVSVLGSIGYILVPAVGPNIAFPELYDVPLGGSLYEPVTSFVDKARAPRDVFPSLHVAISSVVLWYAGRASWKWFLTFLPFVVGNWIATVYLRYHYVVDLAAGWVVAALALWFAVLLLTLDDRTTQWWRERKSIGRGDPIPPGS